MCHSVNWAIDFNSGRDPVFLESNPDLRAPCFMKKSFRSWWIFISLWFNFALSSPWLVLIFLSLSLPSAPLSCPESLHPNSKRWKDILSCPANLTLECRIFVFSYKKNPQNFWALFLFVFGASFSSVLHGVPGKSFGCVCVSICVCVRARLRFVWPQLTAWCSQPLL